MSSTNDTTPPATIRPPITTHVLDTSLGRPAAGIEVNLFRDSEDEDGDVEELASGRTDSDGRVAQWDDEFELTAGSYLLCFNVAEYFLALDQDSFYEDVQIQFTVKDIEQHYHVPLLLNPFGYSTYRGS